MKELGPGKKERSRQRIIEAASHAVRRAGFDGVGVTEAMKEAGLTHGGFYAHFPTRDALLKEALLHASQDSCGLIEATVEQQVARGAPRFTALVRTYLSDEHLRDCEHGCPVAALASEMPHQPDEMRAPSREIVRNLHALVERFMPARAPTGASWAVTSSLVGATQLARTLRNTQHGKAVLAATEADLLARYGP